MSGLALTRHSDAAKLLFQAGKAPVLGCPEQNSLLIFQALRPGFQGIFLQPAVQQPAGHKIQSGIGLIQILHASFHTAAVTPPALPDHSLVRNDFLV